MELNSKTTLKPTIMIMLLSIFAIGYLLSSLLRGVTAALAPILIQEFNFNTAELGLLAGSYFVSFALLQLPMGMFLDRYGVKIVLVISLIIAMIACLLFSIANSFSGLFWARLLCGIGVSACLIAPLTAARLWTNAAIQQRINSWMLMAGALGLVMGTLPAEIVATSYGWRELFAYLGGFFGVVAGLILFLAPNHNKPKAPHEKVIKTYHKIVINSYTWKIGGLGFFNYAILVTIQTLWIGPWLTDVSNASTRETSIGLLYINLMVLVFFLIMGYISPKFIKSANDADNLLRRWVPVSILCLLIIVSLGKNAQWYHFAIYCISAWPLSVTHPLIGQKFAANEAGRAISFFNLLLFIGVFFWQWGFGVLVSQLKLYYSAETSFQIALFFLTILSTIGYVIFCQKSKSLKILGAIK